MSGHRIEIGMREPDYPSFLLEIPSPPPVLYCFGDPTLLEQGLGVVGSRKSTPYGRRCARLFASWAAERGVTVVSGAAMGCDQEAHRAALEVGGPTIAVLGCGADVDYPKGAGSLLKRIRHAGVAVAELPWGTPPKPWQFARRNRIIAAFSSALVVVEASLPSGTFSTAEYAADAGRDVFAVPGSIFAPECRGSNRLIRQGAQPLTDVSELAAALGAQADPSDPDCVVRHRSELARALVADPMRPDDAAHHCGLDIIETVRRISELELEGVVRKYPDGRYGPG